MKLSDLTAAYLKHREGKVVPLTIKCERRLMARFVEPPP